MQIEYQYTPSLSNILLETFHSTVYVASQFEVKQAKSIGPVVDSFVAIVVAILNLLLSGVIWIFVALVMLIAGLVVFAKFLIMKLKGEKINPHTVTITPNQIIDKGRGELIIPISQNTTFTRVEEHYLIQDGKTNLGNIKIPAEYESQFRQMFEGKLR